MAARNQCQRCLCNFQQRKCSLRVKTLKSYLFKQRIPLEWINKICSYGKCSVLTWCPKYVGRNVVFIVAINNSFKINQIDICMKVLYNF